MRIYLTIVFFFLAIIADAQVSDDFSDGDFTNSPSWSGNDSDFNVNPAGQLQLNAALAGHSYLSVPSNLTSTNTLEWRFLIHLDFSPSTSNYCRVYLSSDNPDLQQPLNGYFLQFGESLSNDAIELFRQDGAIVTSVCRAHDGMIASPFTARIKVTHGQSGHWKILVDYSGGISYVNEATGIDSTYFPDGSIGVNCVYTSGNVDGFIFDDFYAGPEIPDTILPFVSGIETESDLELSVTFSEYVDSFSVFNPANYAVDNGIGHLVNIWRDSFDLLKYHLVFGTSFLPATNYLISITGIRDIAMNTMLDQSLSFVYMPLVKAELNDIVFTEIYFEPISQSPLPESEYVEVLNRRDSAVLLSGWKLSDGTSDGLIASVRLGPDEYAVLYDVSDSIEFASIPNAVAVHSFPTLNNDVGDRITLTDEFGTIISEMKFSNEHYHDTHKDDGGWSIERIDADFICADDNNWKASVSAFHGTPGTTNSVTGIFTDKTRPFASNVFLADSNTIVICFSETIKEGADKKEDYIISPADGVVFFPDSICNHAGDTVELIFTIPFQRGFYSIDISQSLVDCAGNPFDASRQIRVGFAEETTTHDVVINEVLFDPYEGGNDFLELYNRSEKLLDLKDWLLEEFDFDDSTIVREVCKLEDHRLLFPGEFIVLTEDEKKVRSFYECKDPQAFRNLSSMPDLTSDKGRVRVSDHSGILIDEMLYDEDMHFPLLDETRGVSLERLDVSEFNTEHNWHSAAATAGFATPGYRSSQRIGVSLDSGVSLAEEIFSPDNDGYNDVLSIHYDFLQTGTMLSLIVFDCNGMQVKKLLSGQTVGSEGTITWDGITDENLIARSGTYILFGKSFSIDGNAKVYKKAFFLTKKF